MHDQAMRGRHWNPLCIHAKGAFAFLAGLTEARPHAHVDGLPGNAWLEVKGMHGPRAFHGFNPPLVGMRNIMITYKMEAPAELGGPLLPAFPAGCSCFLQICIAESHQLCCICQALANFQVLQTCLVLDLSTSTIMLALAMSRAEEVGTPNLWLAWHCLQKHWRF